MKKYYLIINILVLLFTKGIAQNERPFYDPKILQIVLKIWNDQELNKAEGEIASKYIQFHNAFKPDDCGILDEVYLTKPDDNTLVANYIFIKLKWNSFNKGSEKLDPKKVVNQTQKEIPERYELLAFYYNRIFSHVLNNQKFMNHGNMNIELDNLGLYNDTEKAIMFLLSMRHLGRQVKAYCTNHFPDNCFRAISYVERMPKFNNLPFFDFTLPDFEDFLIEIDKQKPKVSFKSAYLEYFHEAKLAYPDCVTVEQNKQKTN